MKEQEDVKEALFELHQYFSDEKAPLMVAESMALLLRYPPDVVAKAIESWVAAQQTGEGAAVSDYLFHTLKKVSLIGDFELVPRTTLGQYLTGLGSAVLPYCPEGERELLKQNLDRLGKAANVPIGKIDIARPGGGGPSAPAEGKASPAGKAGLFGRAVKRLGLFLDRLQPQALQKEPPEHRGEVASQFMTTAAAEATSAKDLEERLAPLSEVGIETKTEDIFRTIAQNLPGWLIAAAADGPAPAIAASQLAAMRQVISLGKDPADVAKRYREMVHAAVEQFNEGNLGRAVAMFELAEKLALEEKVQGPFVESLKKNGHEYLAPDKLRKYAERAETQVGLRTVMNFFHTLAPEGLLNALNGEPKRDRRHELLGLLEAHGPAARAAALMLLKDSVMNPDAKVDPFFQMNLVYLLRVIPRPPEINVEDEINLVAQTPGRDSPPPLVKQVIAYFAATRHEKTEKALITYLKLFETMLMQPETASYAPQEVELLLDRTCAALARYGSPRAWRLLVDHGLKTEAKLGSSYARLADAGRQDLSGSKDIVDRLISALRAEMPKKMLGLTVKKNDAKIQSLIQALSGTPLPEVSEVMQEIVDRYTDEDFAKQAAKTLGSLQSVGKAPEGSASLSGDMELFGLPGLLQTLSQSPLTGVLAIMNRQGKTEATLLFESGKFRGGQFGKIFGMDGVYQLFERPFPGTFSFVQKADVSTQPGAAKAQDVMHIILEGVRRHDEFKRAFALVPDTVTFKPVPAAVHTTLEGEDEDFTLLLWKKVAAGKSSAECEAAISTDSYRVRRLVAHWVEEGALEAAS